MSAATEIFLLGTQERVRNSRGERAISVRATEVLLYIQTTCIQANMIQALMGHPAHKYAN